MLSALRAIAWYEFRMHLQSWRWRGLVLLALVLNFGVYQHASLSLTFFPRQHIAGNGVMPLYLLAVVLAGIHSMGRIRDTGVRPFLMTKSFPTIVLPLGQWLGGLASLAVVFCLALFPAAVLLRLTTEIVIFLKPLLWFLLFCLLPAAGVVLALTFWIRACFKNNLVAIVIIGLIIAGLAVLANGPLLTWPQVGHFFHPLTIHFSELNFARMDEIQIQSTISLLDPVEWRRAGWSLLASVLFLHLTTYHLRRTEPQRRVLGRYGSQWSDMPTFVKLLADLRVDPHLGWRAHFTLGAFLIALAVPLLAPVKPLTRPLLQHFRYSRTPALIPSTYPANQLADGKILPVRILHDQQVLSQKQFQSELTVTLDGPTSGRTVVLAAHTRSQFLPREVAVDGRRIPFASAGPYTFMPAAAFAPFADGQAHKIRIQAGSDEHVIGQNSFSRIQNIPTRGYAFASDVYSGFRGDGTAFSDFLVDPELNWPTRIELTLPQAATFFSEPVPPLAADDHGLHSTRVYELTAAQNVAGMEFRLSPRVRYERLTVPDAELGLSIWVSEHDAPIMREVMALAGPMFTEFYALRRIPFAEPITITLDGWDALRLLGGLRNASARARRGQDWAQQQVISQLDELERHLHNEVIVNYITGRSGESLFPWDLAWFLNHNSWTRMNYHLSRTREFQPEAHRAYSRKVGANLVGSLRAQTRAQRIEWGNPPPVFQMLYLVLGHNAWYDMFENFMDRLQRTPFNPQLIRESAEEAAGENLDWFFDYWIVDGEDYPTYKVLSASADQFTTGSEETTMYRVRAEIQNLGSGRMPVPVRLVAADHQINDTIWIGDGETVTWAIDSNHLPQEVLVDPDGWIEALPYFENNSWVETGRAPVQLTEDPTQSRR